MSPGASALAGLAGRIAAEGEPLHLKATWEAGMESGSEYAAHDPRFGELAASGPLTAADPARYAFVVEAIREGYLCHYGESRLLEIPDPDLALLAGDLLYAIGLNELSGLDDLQSTGILSDLIRVAADLRAEGRDDQAATLWVAQIVALACGKPYDYTDRLNAVAEGDSGALSSLFDRAETTADQAGIGPEFRVAAKAIHLRPSNL